VKDNEVRIPYDEEIFIGIDKNYKILKKILGKIKGIILLSLLDISLVAAGGEAGDVLRKKNEEIRQKDEEILRLKEQLINFQS
jgi:hypothetical protein